MADNRKSVAYLRTSSGTNAGPDKDSEKRQKAAIQRYARRTGITVVEWFNDPAVSGADPIEARPGFSALLDRIENNGVKIVLVEDASRFARDLVAQELGLLMLIKRGVRVLTATGDDMTDTSDPSRIMMRQIAGSFAQYEKARLVAKLKAARDRKKALTGQMRRPQAPGRAAARGGGAGERDAPAADVVAQDQRRTGGARACHRRRQAVHRERRADDAPP